MLCALFPRFGGHARGETAQPMSERPCVLHRADAAGDGATRQFDTLQRGVASFEGGSADLRVFLVAMLELKQQR